MYVLILGGIIIDQYIRVDEYPQRGKDTIIQDFFERVGGCAINVASTIKNLGGHPLIVSQLGMDERGKRISQYLKTKGFSQEAIQRVPDQETGFCLSLVESSGERTFLTRKGCESTFSPDWIDEKWLKKISSAYITGYYLLDSNAAVEIRSFMQRLKKKGITVLFDPGPLVDQMEPDLLRFMVRLADMITPNTDELEKIDQLLKPNQPIVLWLIDQGVEWVIEKRGSRGVCVWTKGKEKRFYPAYPVQSIDTSGAGDSFAGGLLYGLEQYGDMEQAIQIASACGALTTTFMGPHGNFSFKDIIKIIGE